MELNRIYNEDNASWMPRIESESVDVVLTDPPYLYLKNQKLDVFFDENKFFAECKRVLKDKGFIILFGRGTSFYRWNTILAELGFSFKEEIIWDKSYSGSPVNAISRVHETISIYTKCNGVINKAKVPYIEQKKYNIESIIADVKRIKSALNNSRDFDYLIKYLQNGTRTDFIEKRTSNYHTTMQTKASGLQSVNTMKSIKEGMCEKSIIKILRDHYTSIHPTQKPVRLLERLLNLTATHGNIVVDPFSGSGSTAEACNNLGINFLCCEKEKEYYDLSVDRIKKTLIEPRLVM